MILVTVGTNEARFDRLLDAVAELPHGEPLLVQHGHSAPIEHPDARLVDFLPFDELAASVRRARAVVTHAGAGSILMALANGKRPVVVPRLQRFGEAVDDHQLQLARRFADAGLVHVVDDLGLLGATLRVEQVPAPQPPRATALAAELRGYLQGVVGAR